MDDYNELVNVYGNESPFKDINNDLINVYKGESILKDSNMFNERPRLIGKCGIIIGTIMISVGLVGLIILAIKDKTKK